MARKDDIFKSFLKHELLKEKYNINHNAHPSSISEALHSKIPIIKTIALIVDGLETIPPISDVELRNRITQYLNDSAL